MEPEPFTLPHDPKVIYHKITCVECGKEDKNTYCEPDRSQMLDRRLCWDCNFWRNEDEQLAKHHATATIIGGHTYSPGDRTSGSMRGMAGRRFDIEYIDPSVYAGQIITTFDLWSGADLPPNLRAKYPDTARFLNGASPGLTTTGQTVCWDASSGKNPPYKPPRQLTVNKPTIEERAKNPGWLANLEIIHDNSHNKWD